MDKQIYIVINDAQQGPFDFTALRSMLTAHSVTAHNLCWYEGAAGWASIGGTFPELGQGVPPPLPIAARTAVPPPSPPIAANGELQIAGVGDRFIAAVIDVVIMAVLAGAFVWMLVIGGFVLDALYLVGLMCSQLQGTLGMKVMNIKIVDAQGNTISVGASIIRYLMSFVSFFVFCIGYLMIFFTSKHQTLHDLVAGTYVVKR